jgi:phosphatidylinositol alpha-mannosyltransferase
MNVAIVCPYDLGKDGGVQDQAIRLGGWLSTLGHESVLIGPGTDGPEGAILMGSTAVVKANRAATPVGVNPMLRKRLAEAFIGMDVVHIHEPLMPTVSIAATRIGDLPKVGTFHADPPRWVRNTYRGARFLLRRIVSTLDVTTATSPVSASALSGFVSPRIVPNGVEVGLYVPQRKTRGSVTFLGRDDTRKGLDVLVEAWPSVVDQVPWARLTVMGADRTSDRDDIRYLGRVSEETKRAELARSEIYCAPNLGGESFGIVIVEGMASGCAVVASALPAFAHVIGDAGELVAPGDAVGLADRIVAVLEDEDRRSSLSDAATERAKRFDGVVVAGIFVKAYEDAIAAK